LVRIKFMVDLSIPLTRRWMTISLPKVMSKDSFPSLAPVKVPRSAQMPTKRAADNEEINDDRHGSRKRWYQYQTPSMGCLRTKAGWI
jgi:hypothetical protein